MRLSWLTIFPLAAALLLGCGPDDDNDASTDTGALADTTTADTGTTEDTTGDVTIPDDLDPLHITGAPWKGAEEPVVTIVKYSDFECPYCGDANVTMRALLEANPDVRMVYKHLPMDAFHDNARLAAEASMAAFAQDATYFWALHDLMFEHQDALTRADIEGYAETIEGLDMDQFRADLDARAYADAVQANADDAAMWGVRSTPTFLINGQTLAGAQPLEDFQALVDEERAATQPLIDAGLTWEEALAVRLDANLVAAE